MASRVDLILTVGAAGLALIGLADAVAVAEPDLAVLFSAIVLLAATSIVRALGPRRRLGVRADLAAWLQLRADLTGETPEAIADRALAIARVQLGGADDDLRIWEKHAGAVTGVDSGKVGP